MTGEPAASTATVPAQAPEQSRAKLALGLALAAWLCACGPIAALPAFLLARGELHGIRRGRRHVGGELLARLAWWISALSLAFWVVVTGLNVYVLVEDPDWARAEHDDDDWDD